MEMNRRELLKRAGLSSSAMIVGLQIPLGGKKALAAGQEFSHHYLMIGEKEGDFVFTMDKAEMGQGVITGQLTIICEELDINPAKVDVIAAEVDEVYATFNGLQLTGGSSSTPDRWMVLRQAGANIRGAILRAAASKWNENLSDLKTDDGFVISNKSGKRASYNKLSTIVSLEPGEDQKLKSFEEFKYIGKPSIKADAYDKSMGEAEFGIDLDMDGMLTAIVVRSPTFGGKVKSFDKTKVEKLPGITNVVEISSGVAIVGEKYWQVSKARDQLSVTWDAGKNDSVSSASIQEGYKKLLAGDDGNEAHSVGEIETALKDAKDLVDVEYESPYLAHATMEPMNAVAHVQEDGVDVWVATQGPTSVRNGAADLLGIDRKLIHVHSTKYLGGGFGRRSTIDYPMEAIEISNLLKKPVKVIWSREDDMQHSPMRPISRHRVRGLVKDGKAVAWEHRIACESIMQGVMPWMAPHMLPEWLPKSIRSGLGEMAGDIMSAMDVHLTTAEGAKLDYDIPNQLVRINDSQLSIPIHFWRSVGHSYNGFVVESFMDEMAHKAGRDPYEFRRELLSKNKRAVGVLEKVASMSNWGKPTKKNIHRGIAYQFSFRTHVAEVVEIEVVDGNIKIRKVYCAVDCGIAINPDIVEDQMKSGIIYGLSAAMHGKITLEKGAVQQSNFDDYPVMRMSDTPEIEVFITPSKESPTGVGEPGLPPVAAAVGNAIFAGTGKRLRSLPFVL